MVKALTSAALKTYRMNLIRIGRPFCPASVSDLIRPSKKNRSNFSLHGVNHLYIRVINLQWHIIKK